MLISCRLPDETHVRSIASSTLSNDGYQVEDLLYQNKYFDIKKLNIEKNITKLSMFFSFLFEREAYSDSSLYAFFLPVTF